ncbi:MAG: tetratricopeptide repeat protein [Spirulina sp. DLM2.Bin59]|nr:MAG: tetratricopeptide repeat protein [Spirulina sp. DLM2.Bin59]
MNATQTILKITELAELDLPHIRYDAVGQLVLCPVEFVADYPTAQTETITGRSPTQLRTLNAWEQAHIDYVFYWLNIYEPREGCSDLERVEGYLEAFYHLCELSLWQQAYQVVCTPIDGEALHEKLGTWGYYIQQLEIYQKLLNKIDHSIDCLCLNGLGYIFYLLGQTRKSFQHHKTQLRISRKTKNYEYECLAWKGLGFNYRSHDKDKSIRCHLKQLDCAEKYQISSQKLIALLGLGDAYDLWFDWQRSLQQFQDALECAEAMGDQKMKSLAIQGLLSAWSVSCQYRKIKDFLVKTDPEFAQNLSLHQQVRAYELMGRCFALINDYQKSIDFYHKSIKICQQIKDKCTRNDTLQKYDYHTEHNVFHNFGTLYYFKLKNPQAAIEYLEQAYEIAQSIKSSLRTVTTLSVLTHCYSVLGKTAIAAERGQTALALAKQMENPIARYYAMAGLASVAWHQGHYLRGIGLVMQGLWGSSAWQIFNTRLIIKTVLGLMGDKLRWRG